MVKTLLRSSLREIRRSMGRYLAILAIVGLGVGFFAGLRTCQPSMMATGVDYIGRQKLYDFRLLSTLGFDQEDADRFAGLEGVSSAVGAVFTDFLMDLGDGRETVVKAHSLTEGVNLLSLTAGRLPEMPNECVGDARYFLEEDLGSVITVAASNDEDTRELLRYDGYTLVGLVNSPCYLNYDRGTSSIGGGSVAAFLCIPEDGFDFDAYYELYLTMADPAGAYSDAYTDQADALKPAVESLSDTVARERYESLHKEALEKIEDAERELADAWETYNGERGDTDQELTDAYQELTDGEQEYADGLARLEDAAQQVADGELEITDGERQLAASQRELDSARAQLNAADQQLSASEAQLSAAKEQLDAGEASYQQLSALYNRASQAAVQLGMSAEDLIATLWTNPEAIPGGAELISAWSTAEAQLGGSLNSWTLTNMRESLDQSRTEYQAGLAEVQQGRAAYQASLAQYESGMAQLNAARRELNSARQELEDARDELERAPAELEDARRELDDAWNQYNDGRVEADQGFADAETELHDAERELEDAREKLGELKEASTYVLTRQENSGYVCFDNDTSIVAAISVVFPVFFFLVAALVCMTTMKRMVDEQRTQIGVLKALGYSNGQIMGKYLFYSGSAAIVGSAAGYALGSTGLPWIIWEIYGMIYGFAPLKPVFLPLLAGVSFAAALLCSMGATWLSCRVELGRQAAELIRPKTPRAGRRVFLEYITPLWRHLSFLHKVSARNVLRYRSRLIMMVLGIGGCTALLCTGFGIRDSIAHVADDQFGEITLYDYAVTFQDGQTQASAAAYLERSGWTEEEGLLVHSGSADVLAGGSSKSVHLVVSSADSLEGFLSLHAGGEPIPYPGVGEAVLNVGLAENMGISPGDAIQLADNDLGTLDVTVSAVSDNYVFNYVYVSPETYRAQLGEVPEYNTLYVLGHEGADPYEEGAVLLEDEDAGSVSVSEATRTQVDNMLSRLDYIVLVVVLCAAALAFIVLYNLTNINITERIREIATIKVLGFYQKEVAAYIFREINVLSILGSLAGLLMGKALHAFVMEQIQIDSMFFACRILPVSYVISFCMTMLFTIAISTGMRPRLRKIDMAESLKSIE